MDPHFVQLQVFRPKRQSASLDARRSPTNPQMIKMREAAALAHRTATLAKKNTLMNFFRSPPNDFDGSNEAIAKALTISTRTVIRLMNGLVADGRIKVKRSTAKTPMGYRTHRQIYLLQERA